MTEDLKDKMMREEYGKDASGCVWTIVVCIVVVIVLGVILFAKQAC